MKRIQLSDHFNYSKLLRFVLPSICMMIFTSLYSIVDGLFVSNFVGKTPFAAVNLTMPYLMILGAVGFMVGTGGSAIVSRTLGEGDAPRANRYFSMLVYVTIAVGAALTAAGLLALEPAAALLGATEAMLPDCVLYGRIILAALPAFMLQNVFQSFFVAAEKPHLGLAVTVGAGLTNMALDFVLVAVLGWGLAGAALATAFSQLVGGAVPLLYFAVPNTSLLRLTKARVEPKVLGKVCVNGASELTGNISASLVGMLYNLQLMRLAGEDGVAAYGVIMYANFIFTGIFFGYSIGSAPVVSYQFGAGNTGELQNLFRKGLVLMTGAGAVLTLLAELTARPLTGVFVGYDPALHEMTVRGFRLYSLAFLMMGVNIFGSGFFTALNDGVVSAVLAFLRTFVFEIATILILPALLELDGIWLALCMAEGLSLLVTVYFFAAKRKEYRYF